MSTARRPRRRARFAAAGVGGHRRSPRAGVAADRGGAGAVERFTALLDACEALAAERGAGHVELGVNTSRHEAYRAVTARDYRAVMIGVTMHRGADDGYHWADAWVMDEVR